MHKKIFLLHIIEYKKTLKVFEFSTYSSISVVYVEFYLLNLELVSVIVNHDHDHDHQALIHLMS